MPRSPPALAAPFRGGAAIFRFVANLKPYTFGGGAARSNFASYLLSVDYAPGLRPLAAAARAHRRVLVADNGNFDRIGALIAALAPQAAPLAAARRAEEARLGAYARPGQLSRGLAARYAALADVVAAAAAAARRDDRAADVVRAQLALSPAYLVGLEDFTVPLLVALGVERGLAGLPMATYTRAADRAIAYAREAQAAIASSRGPLVFAGLHAADLDTARAVGRRAGRARLPGIAAGFGAALDDRTFTDYRLDGRRVVPLGQAVPRAYVRVLEVAAGLHLGYAAASGRRPRFHALGAGTPILLPLLAALGDRATYTATDSTAPIKDAYSSATIALYVRDPAPMKLKCFLIAQRWMEGARPWDCACPACGAFVRAHPFRLGKARAWWRGEGRRALTPSDMWAPSPLAEWMPLIGMPGSTELRQRAGLARVAHNHWILQRLEATLRRRSRSGAELRDAVDAVVAAYVRAGSAPAWKAATQVAWSITRSASEELDAVDSGGEVGWRGVA